MILTSEQIAEIEKREQAATPGPWQSDDGHGHSALVLGTVEGIRYIEMNRFHPHETMEFIAHAREDIPLLLAHSRELQSQLDTAKANKPTCSFCGWTCEHEEAVEKMPEHMLTCPKHPMGKIAIRMAALEAVIETILSSDNDFLKSETAQTFFRDNNLDELAEVIRDAPTLLAAIPSPAELMRRPWPTPARVQEDEESRHG